MMGVLEVVLLFIIVVYSLAGIIFMVKEARGLNKRGNPMDRPEKE